MEKLQKRYKIGKNIFNLSTACLSTSLVLGTITALAGMVNPISILAADVISMGTMMIGNSLAAPAKSSLYQKSINYYDDRAELDHLKRGEAWKTSPDGLAACGITMKLDSL